MEAIRCPCNLVIAEAVRYDRGCYIASTDKNADAMMVEALLTADCYTEIVLI